MRRGILVVLVGLVLAGCNSNTANQAELPELTEEFACGYGFYLSNSDQTVGLLLTYRDYDGAAAGRVAPNAEIDIAWGGELQFGTNLFANWCDDVLEEGEPTPIITETWAVTGRVEVTQAPGADTCGPASANLTELVGVNPDGGDFSFGDLSVDNEFWGCFAG